MKEVSNNKTQRLRVNQYDPLYLLSIKNQVDSKRENMDESNMFKENIIKEILRVFVIVSGPRVAQRSPE